MSTNSGNDDFQLENTHATADSNNNNIHFQQPTVEDADDNDGGNNQSQQPTAENTDDNAVGDNQSQEPSEKDEIDSDDDENTPLILNQQQANQQVTALLGNLVPHMNFSNHDAIIAATMAAAKKYLLELPKQVYKRIKMWKDENPKLFWFIVICVILGISLPVTIHLIGFTAGGVAAGSIAAGIHSGIGSVVAGSGFAIMQSITATGLLAGASFGFAAGVPVLAVLTARLKKDGWFTAAGNAAGSVAAGIYSGIGSVVAGSGFAIMQISPPRGF